jgi:NAD(P)-dependent dehydrogenase (short-subunit alcohol dehydrogenase family)
VLGKNNQTSKQGLPVSPLTTSRFFALSRSLLLILVIFSSSLPGATVANNHDDCLTCFAICDLATSRFIKMPSKKSESESSTLKDAEKGEGGKEYQEDINDPCRPAVPQLSGVTAGDLETAIRVMSAVADLNTRKRWQEPGIEVGLELYKHPNLRPFRKVLSQCWELHKRTMFAGKSEELHYEQRKAERSLKRQKMAEAQQQKKYIADTALRKGRMERLRKLQDEAKEEEHQRLMAALVPDGHVKAPELLENGEADESDVKLPKLRSCYVCKVRYRDLHHFYDQLCPTCAPLNWTKRHQTADLIGKIAVVTGARVKIGLQVCLKLLRNGATVVATTRFPNSAAATYRQEGDFDEWKDRLQIYGLDLRDVTGIEAFTRFLKIRHSEGVDILINNACQTVRRPRGYYVPMVEKEQNLWTGGDVMHKNLLRSCAEFEDIRRKLVIDHAKHAPGSSRRSLENGQDRLMIESTSSGSSNLAVETVSDPSVRAPFHSTGLSHSAAMSQMIILPEDAGVSDSVLPPGVSDINGQQLDLRQTNSWLLKMEEVSTPEIMECMFINAIAPFVLNSRLKPLMTCPNDDSRPDRFIINVSAMEGKFYRFKMPNHPHTNMAKAALNMMTRTSAEDLACNHRIFMNSVDTGWINDENPLEKASKIAKTNLFQTPIDEIDAAARILDPVFMGVQAGREGDKDYGKFLKDYKETEW